MTELLVATDENPVPEGTQAGMLAAPGGQNLRYALFRATGRPLKGTVILLQGRNEFIEKYFETARDLSARGFMIAAFDLRGQGGSGRLLRNSRAGYVDSFDHYVADLDHFFESVVLPDCRAPFFVLAHSTGGLVALLAAERLVNRVRRMVLSAPLIRFASGNERTARFLSGALTAMGLGAVRLASARPQSFERNVLTSDRVRYERNIAIAAKAPDLALGGPAAAWISAAIAAMDRISRPEFLDSMRLPVLMVAAGADRVVSTSATEALARRMRSAGSVTIDGARHELLQESDFFRNQVLAAFDAFIPGSGDPMF